ncbi:MAG: type I pullulanase [Xylanivirga thermophila]|jgi:pullulanase|uniref:type I pullulanase n=1 Tax=Xylanivirga thermophila TaxID=2496273 RepID=UPI0039F6468B
MKINVRAMLNRVLCTLMVFAILVCNIPQVVAFGQEANDEKLDMVTIVGDFFEKNSMGSNWNPKNPNGVMRQYFNNIYEISMPLDAGVYYYKVALNGSWDQNYANANGNVNTGDNGNAKIALDTDQIVHFRFDNNNKKLYDSINNLDQFRQSATLVGSLEGMTENGRAWDPADTNFDLEYIGGGFYRGVFELGAGNLEYKIAFNHGWGNGELGEDGNNIVINIKSSGLVVFLANTIEGVVYDSIRNPEIKDIVSLIGPIRKGIDEKITDDTQWDNQLRGFEFYQISDYELAFTALLPKGTYEYKGIENYSWDGGGLPPEAKNYELTISKDLEYVVFVADLRQKNIINSIEHPVNISIKMGLQQGASAKLVSAIFDNLTEIDILTTRQLSDEDLNSFYVMDDQGQELEIKEVKKIDDNRAKLILDPNVQIDVSRIYQIGSDRFEPCSAIMRGILDQQEFYYNGDDLGVTYNNDASIFKLWAPTAKLVSLVLYDNAGEYNGAGEVIDHSSGKEIEMQPADKGIWQIKVDGDLNGKFYMYKVEFANNIVNYAVDPYAKAVSANGQRSAIVDLKSTDPEGFAPYKKPAFVSPTDAVIYELHVRDFSIDENSGMENKGKFLALTENDTKGPEDIYTGIAHLKDLGITHVHLLPVFDFKTIDELQVDNPDSSKPKYNWGYDPQNYNAPEGSYSTDPTDPKKRIEEFKQMVQVLHDNGIRVIMDVVYNHTYTTGQSPFDAVVPGFFYRTDDNGKYTNGSGCGNEIATERAMVKKYIKDSVKYWVKEYGVDGFRFDLMGLIDNQTMTEITQELKDIDPSIFIYGEPWQAGGSPLPVEYQTTKGKQKGKGFAVFNDNFRNAIKGGNDDATKGFATGESGKEQDIVNGIRGAIDDFTDSPTETINYITCHDNLNLWDKIIKSQGLDNSDPYKNVDLDNVMENETVKRSILANGIVLTSQGVPFIQAGDEILRTKYGDHNSYKSPDAINKISWQNKAMFKPVFDYYRGIIKLRKEHPAFRMNTKEAIENNLVICRANNDIVVYQIKEYANNDPWKNIVVVYNGSDEEQEVQLPFSTSWNIVVDHEKAGVETIRTVEGDKIQVKPISLTVLYDEKQEYIQLPTSIEVSSDNIGIEPRKSKSVTAFIKDQYGRLLNDVQLNWKSANPEIASVNQYGQITGNTAGKTVITVYHDELSVDINVTVGSLYPERISITGSDEVFETKSIILSAKVLDQFGKPMSNTQIQWESSDPSIAKVDFKGQVTGIKPGTVIITAKTGNIECTKSIKVIPYIENIIRFKYIRPDGDYGGWNIWVWYTGVKDGQIDFKEIKDGAAIANIKVSPGTERVGFVLRKGTDWEEKDAYSADRYIDIDKNELITKVTVRSGVGEFKQPQSITGPEFKDGKIIFYYRDSDLYSQDLMHTVDKVKLKITDSKAESGYKFYDMSYSEENEYFYCPFEPNADVERYEYSFTVRYQDGSEKEFTDPYNPDSYVEYKIPDFDIASDIQPNAIDYTQNAVVSIQLSNNIVKPREIYLNLTELGGEEEYPIDVELMKGTIAVKDTILAGDKNIPITVVDEYGNKHIKNAKITIKPRVIKDAGDFDWDESVIYFLLTDRFMNGDTSNDDPNGEQYDKNHPETYHGGDLKGITKKLDYLKDLGVNTIWITPIVDNIDFNKGVDFTNLPENQRYQYGYHGYWAQDFTNLDEHLGILEDLHELIDEAHNRDMKIMVDVVINHAGYGLKPGDEKQWGHLSNFPSKKVQDKFYIDINGETSSMFRDGGSDEVKGELAGLPDFMTEIPEVRDQIIKWQTDWLDKAKTKNGNTIDCFRVDTVKHVEDTTWKAFKNRLTEKAPNFKLIGEYFGASVDNAFNTQLDRGQMDSLLDFEFKNKARAFTQGKIDEVEEYLEYRNKKLTNTATLGQFLSSHDEDGFLYSVGGDINKLKVASTLQITAKGQPIIYYGEELGLTGKNADDMSKGEFSENRYDMDWSRLDNKEYISIYEHYKTLLNIRRDYSKIFAKGNREKVAGSDTEQYLVFKRSYCDECIYTGINLKNNSKQVSIQTQYPSNTVVEDLYSSKTYTVKDGGNLTFELPSADAGGTAILVVKNNGKPEKPIVPVEPEEPEESEVPEKEWVLAEDITINGKGHIQGIGDIKDENIKDIFMLGTVGKRKHLEGFILEFKGLPSDMMVVYRAHIQTYSDMPNKKYDKGDGIWKDDKGAWWKKQGFYLGTKGERRRVEGIELMLVDKNTDKAYKGYSIEYQVHMQGYGWGIDDKNNDLRDDGSINDSFDKWAKDGAFAGTRGDKRRTEAIRIRILKEEIKG